MRFYLLLAGLCVAFGAFAQQAPVPFTKRVIVKTNVLSLLAQRPTLSVEKLFTKTFAVEASFVQGQFSNLLFTDHYAYTGFLLRAKKYIVPVAANTVAPYTGFYLGNLKRNIQTAGGVLYPSRDFSSNSLRAGGSVGLSYITKQRVVLDMQGSLGYGRYLNLDKSDPDTYATGFLDTQVWFSVGYCF